MQSVSIQDTKIFMQQLLAGDTFDSFLVSDIELKTFVTFSIRGKLHSSYFDSPDPDESVTDEYCSWKQIKQNIYDLIKGKRTPLSFHIVLKQSSPNTERFIRTCGLNYQTQDISGLFLNIYYDGKSVTCTTGSSLCIFTLDKAVDHAWDDIILKLFKQKRIPYITSTQS